MSAEFRCNLCLERSKPFGKLTKNSSMQLQTISSEIFNEKVSLTHDEWIEVCPSCRKKLKSFHDFYKMIIKNRQTAANEEEDEFDGAEYLEDDAFTSSILEQPAKKVAKIADKFSSPESSTPEPVVRTPKFICEICAVGCATQHGLNIHKKYSHAPDEDVPKKTCPICSALVPSLDFHMRQHNEPNVFSCSLCEKAYKDEESLQKHVFRCHRGGIHVCKYCQKQFKAKQNWIEHEAIHTGTSLYFCEFCTAQFKSNGNYLGHKRKNHPVEYQKQKAENEAKRYLDMN